MKSKVKEQEHNKTIYTKPAQQKRSYIEIPNIKQITDI